MHDRTWEQAVLKLRSLPDQQTLVRACYYDDPLIKAAQRFSDSDEWRAVRKWLPTNPGRALDLGAGRGISSYALARAGWQVTALEPDSSSIVGTGAIRRLADESRLPIAIQESRAEQLPFADASFELVYGRAILHHISDLPSLCREVRRVLIPGGRFVATREPVISQPEDLSVFLAKHPLQALYGGENALQLNDYLSALKAAPFSCIRTIGHYDSVVNYYPMPEEEWNVVCTEPLRRRLGPALTALLTSSRTGWGRWLLRRLAAHQSNTSNMPGRHYSFIAGDQA